MNQRQVKVWRGVIAAATAALSACQTTGAVMSEQPHDVIRSAKSQTEVSFCLAEKWRAAALDHPSGAKVIVVKNDFGDAGVVISVYPDGTGSRTEFRKGYAPLGFRRFRTCF